MDFAKLPKDVRMKMALELSPPDLISFCLSETKQNKEICSSNVFWMNKLERDYPEELYDIVFTKKGKSGISRKILDDPKAVYIQKFKHVSEEIEELITDIISVLFGYNFLNYLTKEYKDELYRAIYKIYEEASKSNPDEEEMHDLIFDHTSDLIPAGAVDNIDPTFDKIKEFLNNILLNDVLEKARRGLIKSAALPKRSNVSTEPSLKKSKKMNSRKIP